MKSQWLKNSWYPIAHVSELTTETQPLRKVVLGQHLALFLSSEGNYVALNDVCPHMGAALSLGCVKDGSLVCRYHQCAFGPGGKCTTMPAILAPKSVPSLLMVDSYPVVLKYDLLWVFLGDLAENERPPLVTIPEFDDPAFHKSYYHLKWTGSVRAMLENLLDFTHFSYLHPETFGNGDFPFVGEYEVNKGEHDITCSVKVKLNTKNWFFPLSVLETDANPDVTVDCHYHAPTVVVNSFSVGGFKDVTLFTFTPLDWESREVLVVMYNCKNYERSEEQNSSLAGAREQILREDSEVIATCVPEVLPRPVPIKVDRYLAACRHMYDSLLAAGNRIERHVYQTENRGLLTIIPSPVRKENDAFGRGWQRREDEEANEQEPDGGA